MQKPLSPSTLKARRVRIALAAISLALAAALALALRARASTEKTPLLIAIRVDQGAVMLALRRELGEFSSLHPRIELEIIEAADSDALDRADLIVMEASRLDPVSGAFAGAATLWYGSSWSLAVNGAWLAGAEARHPTAAAALRAGTANAADFELLLRDAKGAGLDPIAIGNSHGWPWLMWLQHWAAAIGGPEAAARGADDVAVHAAYEELRRWADGGYFARSTMALSWVEGLSPLAAGRAAMALLGPGNITAFSPAARAGLAILPFPRGDAEAAWSIGSGGMLGLGLGLDQAQTGGWPPISKARSAAAKRLLGFLGSHGVTARMAAATGLQFYAVEDKPAARNAPAGSFIPAWLGLAGTPDWDRLMRRFPPPSP